MKRHFFPTYSTKKDATDDTAWIQITKFLKDNSHWQANSAMIATIVDNGMYVKKTKGPQKFIFFRQNQDGSFVFPFIEASALLFSKKLITLSLSKENNIFSPSAHFLVNYLINNCTIPFNDIKLYSFFSRIGATSRKPKEIKHNKISTERFNTGYAALIKQQQNHSPQMSTDFKFTDVFPISQLVKIPSDRKMPEDFAFSLSSIQPNSDLQNEFVCVPFTLQCMISVQDIPEYNPNHLI